MKRRVAKKWLSWRARWARRQYVFYAGWHVRWEPLEVAGERQIRVALAERQTPSIGHSQGAK